ncbi:hypothetical protein BBP11_10345 [Limosilactobacillus reuteri]|nr:hypothetical protein BBP11_10345 [Limosilactobacillus reuteri]
MGAGVDVSLRRVPCGVWAFCQVMVADQSLNSAMHHRLGKPLPYQLANAPQVHPRVIAKAIFQTKAMWLLLLCGISICFQMLSPAPGQVTYVLLTRPPLTGDPSSIRCKHHQSVGPVRTTCMY